MSSVSASPSHWLSECLCDLMASPHVTMPTHGGLHLGPGPVDVFTTRFNRYFMPDARGTICGHPADRGGIMEGLLALQRKWNTEDVKVIQEGKHHGFSLQHHVLSTEVEFTPPGDVHPEFVTAEASVAEEEGDERIRFMKLEGNSALFRV